MALLKLLGIKSRAVQEIFSIIRCSPALSSAWLGESEAARRWPFAGLLSSCSLASAVDRSVAGVELSELYQPIMKQNLSADVSTPRKGLALLDLDLRAVASLLLFPPLFRLNLLAMS